MVHIEIRVPPGLLMLRVSGPAHPGELLAALDRFRQTPGYRSGLPSLSDWRALSTHYDRSDLDRVAAALPTVRGGTARAAILVSNAVDFGMARMFDMRFGGRIGYDHHVCYTWEEAVRALGFDPHQVPEWTDGHTVVDGE